MKGIKDFREKFPNGRISSTFVKDVEYIFTGEIYAETEDSVPIAVGYGMNEEFSIAQEAAIEFALKLAGFAQCEENKKDSNPEKKEDEPKKKRGRPRKSEAAEEQKEDKVISNNLAEVVPTEEDIILPKEEVIDDLEQIGLEVIDVDENMEELFSKNEIISHEPERIQETSALLSALKATFSFENEVRSFSELFFSKEVVDQELLKYLASENHFAINTFGEETCSTAKFILSNIDEISTLVLQGEL